MASASPPASASTPAIATETSNIEAFVASTTPVFIARRRVENDETNGETSSTSVMNDDDAYVLSELWDAFAEPSAFGAEVPLRLQEGQDVSQYYVPFLSGVQLFVRGERDARGEGEGERARSGTTEKAELIFEFFEKSSPYARASMSETIESIVEENPRLRGMTTRDLAPSSWMSVAWYPIYRIPQGTMLHDVQGCFLTYHALYVGELQDGDIACPLPPRMTDAQEALIEERVTRALERDGADGGAGGRARVLRPFGLSMYKMQGDVWAANDEVTAWMNKLMDGAYTWLRMRKTVHPDYEFFSHFG